MPEKVPSYSSQRFSALLDFQRDVDPTYPSHIGYKGPLDQGLSFPGMKALAYHQVRHGDSWHQNLSSSFITLLSSPFAVNVSSPPSRCRLDTGSTSRGTLTKSQGQFSPQTFIRNALKRVYSRDDQLTAVKKAKFEDYSTAESMVFG